MKAHCLIRPQPWYRREAFVTGLRMAGLEVHNGEPRQIDRDTVVVMWNRYDSNHQLACRVEAAGGTVIVAENGYIGQGGSTPKFDLHGGVEPEHYYALAIGGHNGSGQWPGGGPERFARLGITLQPWRTDGEHILVCPSRNFGRPDLMMPSLWVEQTVNALRRFSRRPVRVRNHPGNHAPQRPLADDLAGAAAVVVWYSSAGVHALIEGIPVFSGAPHWICKSAACERLTDLEIAPARDHRPAAFERLAWAQWTVDEIASGEPFNHLLRNAAQG